MTITIIAAIDKNRLIGKGSELPWNFPEDLRHFKKKTMGKFVIMGQKTYDSIGKPLPGRKMIILSRDSNYNPQGVEVAGSIEKALSIADGEVMIAGGKSIYKQFLPLADKMFLTVIDNEFEGDIYFPDFKEKEWEIIREKKGENKILTFKEYKKYEE